ncbi:serine/threonine protein kinase [Pyxidicoccus trucidator]|uniref:serine/threonine protein kinase n=1 Tax=Pyxidicoccus trucidator TaxID=2709662 RepID=UPI0013D97D8C|nr:serine/threonine-protein kinase [Pyxidicoccus trucidator]
MAGGYLNPARLPPGTQVGPWRVVNRLGMGTYGAVYLAVGPEQETPGPVALKLALYPRDARFKREGELLSRLCHPAVPRLLDSGHWKDAAGARYPYLAMEFVQGASLYIWAQAHLPSSRQLLRLLATLARALEATHSAGGVHRDVKGDNVLVRHSDGHVFLTDFGSGNYLGATPLTSPPFPPGTPEYRSPEAWRYVLDPDRDVAVPYAPGPADDVFALGVTAYRLMTGEYPPSLATADDGARLWLLAGNGPRPPGALNERCCAELSALVSRMLSPTPETRGSARELAVALERAARHAGPEADASLFVRPAPESEDAWTSRPRVASPARRTGWSPWVAAASLGVALTLAGWMLSMSAGDAPAEVRASAQGEALDGGAVAVGDSALMEPVPSSIAPFAWSTIAVDMPLKPFPGQQRPDPRGRCPRKGQVPLQGSCWLKLDWSQKDCEENGYVYKDGCFVPAYPPPRPATSGPAN